MSVATQTRASVRTLSRLLPRAGEEPSLAAHIARHGRLPALRGESAALISAVEESGLRGRGGAGFPTHVKLRAVAAGRSPIVVANGVEGEPASHKDSLLMRVNPHLVLDGAVAAAAAVGAREIMVAVGRGATSAHASLARAIAERAAAGARERIELFAVPDRFVAGEETALVQWLNGGPAKPAFVPPRPFERGVRGRPTLVQNVETLANIALIARHGADWFRELGSAQEPGSMLVTLGGAVGRPGITEVESGSPLRDALERCDGFDAEAQALLVGGYFGTWVPFAAALDAPLSDAGLRPLGAALGARSIAGAAARQLRGRRDGAPGRLPRPRERRPVRALRVRAARDRRRARRHRRLRRGCAGALERLRRLAPQVAGRGACAHPDGATRLVASALAVFADEIRHHLAGHCSARSSAPVLPIPPAGRSGDEAAGRPSARQPDPLRRVRPLRRAAPELISLDEWGYPIIADGPVPAGLQREARRAVSLCPRLALLLEQRDADGG